MEKHLPFFLKKYEQHKLCNNMRIKHLLTMLLAVVVFCANSQSKTYFVSPDGNDQASGLSQKDAWKTLERVNQVTFQPGDKILFEAGGVWYGQLKLKGSGAPEKPVTMSGYGGKERPVINLGRAEGAGIRLENQSWWVIDNMQVTSGVPHELGIGRQGIAVIVRGENQHVEGIVIRNCYIHDIWGQLGGSGEFFNYASSAIYVAVQNVRPAGGQTPGQAQTQAQGQARTQSQSSTLNDVLIEHNRIERVDKCGIVVRGCRNNMLVRHNYIEGAGGDGIYCQGMYRGVIEYNEVRRTCLRTGYLDLVGGESWWPHTAAIWIQNAEESVMQFNEVYDTGRQPGNGDGFAYDFDFNCVRCTAQYNYSKNNAGFMLIMNRTFENVTRYNISENDQTHLIQMHGDVAERNIFYNNIFYIDYGTVDLDFFLGDYATGDKNTVGATFINNIFYAAGQSHFRTAYTSGFVLERKFDEEIKTPTGSPEGFFYNNLYYGPWKNGIPDDPKKIVGDPLFVKPGSGGNGLATLDGYMLREDSPAINAGIFIPLNGGRDFFGNPVEDGKPDLGAYEQIGSGVFADPATEQESIRIYMTKSRLANAKRLFPTAIRAPEDGNILISFREPIDPSITGSITWNNSNRGARPANIVFNRPQSQRNNFAFTVRTGKDALLNTSLRVVLQDGEFKEEWDIPFTETAPPRR
jgi:hypothetical protein